jgi:hypothetical protein
MTPEERFQRIEENLDIATGLIVKIDKRLDRISDRLDRLECGTRAMNGGNGVSGWKMCDKESRAGEITDEARTARPATA